MRFNDSTKEDKIVINGGGLGAILVRSVGALSFEVFKFALMVARPYGSFNIGLSLLIFNPLLYS